MSTGMQHWEPERFPDPTTDPAPDPAPPPDPGQQFAADVYDAACESLLDVARAKRNIEALAQVLIGHRRDEDPDDAVAQAHEYLLKLARDPQNIALASRRITQGVDAQLAFHARLREQFTARVLSCGHAARLWQVRAGESVDDFVADPEAHGECLVCQGVKEALADADPRLRLIDLEEEE